MHNYEKLIQKIREGEVVLWAGAGFSRYAGIPFGKELADIIRKHATGLEKEILKDIHSLPELTEEFVKLRAGRKADLFSILKNVFNVILDTEKLLVHNALKNILQIDTIITTNYDTLFEQAYKNNIEVIIKDDNIATASKSANKKKVKLFKIHSDFSNQDSIILTSSDYRNFFRDGVNRPLWTEIKSIIAKKSIFFVGYSLEDPNVQYIFDEILRNLGEFSNECFLACPNVPQYKQNYLLSRNISYIDMTAEEIIPKLDKDIRVNWLEDCDKGFLDHSTVIERLQKEGIDIEYQIGSGNTIISSIGSNKEDVSMKVKVEFKGDNKNENYTDTIQKVNDVVTGKSFEPIIIPGEYVGLIDSRVNGIIMDDISPGEAKYEHVQFVPYPEEEYNAHLYFEGTEEPEEAVFRRFESRYLIQTEIVHKCFKIAYKFKLEPRGDGFCTVNEKFDFGIQMLKTPDILQGNKIVKLLLKWFDGGSVTVYKADEYSKHFDLVRVSSYKALDSYKDYLNTWQYIYSNLILFQRYFNINFMPFERVTEDEMRLIRNLRAIIDNNGKLPINQLNVPKAQLKGMERELQEDIFVIDDVGEEREVITLLGAKLDLGYPRVLCHDAYAVNYNDEASLIVIKSRSGSLYIEFIQNTTPGL